MRKYVYFGWPEVMKLFSCSTQLCLKFILLINVKMPTIVGILTFMSRINYQFLSFEPEFSTNFDYFNIYKQLKFPEHEFFFITYTKWALKQQKAARDLQFWI